jgi:hypothetical protein
MGTKSDNNGNSQTFPPRIRAAFDYLDHVYFVTTQRDVSLPARTLTPLEKSVESAALRALQQYLLGEMDFGEKDIKAEQTKNDDEDGTASTANNRTT